jgi:hypothetical protein
MSLVFEWDPRKAQANLLKHRVSFAEATSVFSVPMARIFDDEYHSADELREIIVGHSKEGRLLLICFTELENDRIRIISARRATKKELHDYQETVKR